MQFKVNRNIDRIIRAGRLKKKDVAVRAGFSEMVFSNICRCKRKVYADEVIPIALALGVSVEELFKEA